MKSENYHSHISNTKIISKNNLKPFLILLIGFIATVMIALITFQDVEQKTKVQNSINCKEIAVKLLTRLQAHALLLRSGAAYFSGSDSVTRAEWKVFYEREKINNIFPGLQGLGYAKLVSKASLKQHVEATRKEGFPNYMIKPTGERDVYTSIIYLEPFEGRNICAIGYDMLTEPTRRKAMQQACDRDVAILSGKVTLVQDNGDDDQAGALMYVPIYRNGMPINTIIQRRTAIKGWVYSPYRINDLMQNILGNFDLTEDNRLHLQIYDEKITSYSLVFDSQSHDSLKQIDSPNRSISIPIVFNGKKWILYFTQEVNFSSYFQGKVLLILTGGCIITLLLFLLFINLTNTRIKAEKLAETLTADLKSSEDKLNAIFQNSCDALGVLVNGVWVMCNPAILRLFGFNSQDELLGTSILNVIAPDSREMISEFVRNRIQENDAPLEYLTRGLRTDGKVFELEVVISSILLENNRHVYFTMRDITLRLANEKTLKESEARFKNMFEKHASIMLLIEPESGKIIDANHSAAQFYGYSIANLCSITIDSINSNNKKEIEAERKLALKECRNYFIFNHRLASGQIRIVEVHSSPVNYGENVLLFSIINDVTDRKQAENALQLSNNNLRTAQRITKTGNWTLNLKTNQLEWSDEMYNIYDIKKENFSGLINDLINERIHPNDKHLLEQAKKLAVDQKIVPQIEFRIVKSDGSICHLSSQTGDFVLDKDGIPILLTGITQDITIHKQFDTKIQDQNRQLTELNSTKDKFFGIIAHDLRNPFNGILVMSDLIVKNKKTYTKEKLIQFSELIYEEARTTYKLLENLLEWANVQTGAIEFKPTKLKLDILVFNGISQLASMARAKSITLEYDIPDSLLVYADLNMLNTIIRNLLTNAIKFTNPEGQITITAFSMKNKIEIRICDNGVGMTADKKNMLFEINEKISTKGTAQESGSGLGLLLCKEFVNKHGGEIWVESELGKGTTFIFTLNDKKEVGSK